MDQLIPLHLCDYLCKILIKTKVATDQYNSWKEMWTLNKIWNCSSCAKVALNVSWNRGLIAQSVRASEWNSVVAGSNPSQVNFLQLLLRILQWVRHFKAIIKDCKHKQSRLIKLLTTIMVIIRIRILLLFITL